MFFRDTSVVHNLGNHNVLSISEIYYTSFCFEGSYIQSAIIIEYPEGRLNIGLIGVDVRLYVNTKKIVYLALYDFVLSRNCVLTEMRENNRAHTLEQMLLQVYMDSVCMCFTKESDYSTATS